MSFDAIKSRIDRLNYKQTVFYGLIHIERILHLYKLFEDEIRDADNIFFDIYKNGCQSLKNEVDKIYEYVLLDEKLLIKYAEDSRDNILLFAIDSDAYSSNYSALAQSIAIAVCYLCEYIISHNSKDIICCHNGLNDCIDIIEYIKDDDYDSDDLFDHIVAEENILDDELITLIEGLIVDGSPYKIDELKLFTIKHRVDIANY